MLRLSSLLVAMALIAFPAYAARKHSHGHKRHKQPVGVSVTSDADGKTGNLIALWIEGAEPVLIKDKYAVYICWPNPKWDRDWANHRVFLFYDNVNKKTYRADTFQRLLAVLARQPRNLRVIRLDSCCQSRCWMGDKEWQRLKRAMKKRNMKWADSDNSIFCTCETAGVLIYPGDLNAPAHSTRAETREGKSETRDPKSEIPTPHRARG